MIAFKQPLLASDTQLQPGTSSDSKSTMMDCLAKTADQRRSKFRSVSDCTRHVQSPEIAFPVQTSKSKTEFSFAHGCFLELRCNYVINYWEFSHMKKPYVSRIFEFIDLEGSTEPENHKVQVST